MPDIDEPIILTERSDTGVVRLTLNRPKAFNALSEAMLAALQAELEKVADDETARVVVIAGAGRAFCAGHDLKEMRASPSQGYYEGLFADCTRTMLAIQKLPVPVIARVHGIATAAGCQLVATCDLAVAASDARFAVSGVNYGLFCSTPSVALARNVLRKQAMEMLLTGDFIDAAEAKARGLVNRVAPLDHLDARSRRPDREDRRKAPRRDRHRQAAVLPPGRGRHRASLCHRRRGHGLQHDGRGGAGRRPGLHRQAPADVEADRLRFLSGYFRASASASRSNT